MISRGLIEELRRIVGERHVSESRTAAELYSYDGSLAKGAPGAVVFPSDTRQTALVAAAAARAGVPFVPRGFGTNLSGGTVLPHGGLTVCLARLNRILGIHPEQLSAVVQPGVTNLELQNALAPLGFFYAPDPASQKVATLGGNVGENSGGPHCLKYGVTTNHILGLEAVLAGGDVLRIGGAALDPPGYDLRGLLVGSEGTLAVVTEVTVRIMPRPQRVITQLAVYDDVAAAAQSVSDIVAAGIVPATLEMMDAPIIRAVEDSAPCGYPRDAAAVLIIEVEGPDAGLDEQAAAIREICMRNRCREIRDAADAAERSRLWEGRRGAFGAVARLAPNFLVNDCTVPRNRLPQALAQVAAVVKKHGFVHGNVFHAGDGNLHPLILFDSRDPDQLERVHKAGWEIMEACAALGGTISGEHGIGVEKMAAMRLVFSETEIEAQRSLQAAFDPDRRLNPGKIFPEPDRTGRLGPIPPAAASGLSAAEQALVETVNQAISSGGALRPTGGGRGSCGNLTADHTLPLRTAALGAMVELDPANQVFTAETGMTLAAVQDALAAHNQWLPLRPACAPLQRTLGGIAATGACGPERLAFGAPRDLMLGLRFVDGRGRVINAGGKVVKNVAGYDMTRLLVGSGGTLGLITRVTLRMATRPERCVAVSACHSPERCAQLAIRVLGSSLGAVFAAAVPEGPKGCWRLSLGFEGFEKTVTTQAIRAEGLFREAGFTGTGTIAYDLLKGPFAEIFERIDAHPWILRINLAADRTAAAARWVGAPAPEALVDFGCGSVIAGLTDLPAGDWRRIGREAAAAGGHAVLDKAPDEFRREHDVFGPPRPEWRLSHRIKEILDPERVFSPGAMPGRV